MILCNLLVADGELTLYQDSLCNAEPNQRVTAVGAGGRAGGLFSKALDVGVLFFVEVPYSISMVSFIFTPQ
jgi:hypothetical protein